MKRIFISCALFLCTISLSAQTKMTAKEAALKIADRILDSTTYEFKNTKTGEVYKSVKKLPLSMDVKVACKYNNWHYTNGVTNIALMELADKVGDKKYLMKVTLISFVANTIRHLRMVAGMRFVNLAGI